MWTTLGILSIKKGSCLSAAFQWRLCSNVIQIPKTRLLIGKKLFHTPRRKLHKSLFHYANVGLGVSCGLALNFIRVDCHDRKYEKEANRFIENEESKTIPNFNWSQFFQLLKPYCIQLVGAIAAALACALLNICIPKVLGNLIDILSQASRDNNNFMEDLKKPASTMLFYYTLHSLFTFCYIALLSQIAEGMAKKMKLQLFSSMMAQDITFFDKYRTGELLNRLTVDIHDFKSSFKMVVSQGLRNSAQIIGCSVTLLQISPQMTAIMMLVVPTVILAGSFVGSLLRQVSFETKSQTALVTMAAEEAISNIRTVRSFAMEDIEKKIFEQQVTKSAILEIRLGRGIAIFQAGTNLFLNGMVLTTIYMGGYMLRTGSITAGDLMAFLVTVQIMQRSFSQISLLFGAYIKGIQAGAKVFEMIHMPPGVNLKQGKIVPYHSLVPDVELKDVEFSYPNRPEHKILHNINVKIPASSTVAIVGPSGSGKSTVALLIERLYDVEKGAVLIGGEDVRTLNPSWLRGQVIGFISQEPLLFATTILENIRYGKPQATDGEVIEAAKLANADEFIRRFPDGYQTKVGERGIALSGGQRQRIAIARALLKKPSILILDEATSALDAESEKLVQNALDKITKTRTTIIIAHRLSTVINADTIIVLSNGKIVEMGTHEDLMRKKGMYASLVSQQLATSSQT